MKKGSRQTHCQHRHEMVGDNVYVSANGNRACRKCSLERSTIRYSELDPSAKSTLLYKQMVRQTGRTEEDLGINIQKRKAAKHVFVDSCVVAVIRE